MSDRNVHSNRVVEPRKEKKTKRAASPLRRGTLKPKLRPHQAWKLLEPKNPKSTKKSISVPQAQ